MFPRDPSELVALDLIVLPWLGHDCAQLPYERVVLRSRFVRLDICNKLCRNGMKKSQWYWVVIWGAMESKS
jgi:hypothetical protein